MGDVVGRGLDAAVVEGLRRPEAELSLPAGTSLLLYTDGLVERRDLEIGEGMERAAQALSAARGLPPAEAVLALRERLLADDPDDDVAFLVYRSPT